VLGKEGRWPLDIIPAVSAALPAATMTEDASQASPHPAAQVRKDKGTAMLEVLKPAAQTAVQDRDERGKARAVGTPGLGSDRVLRLIQALSPRPTQPPFEVIAQKIEAARWPGVHNPRLHRMQSESRWRGPHSHLFQRSFGSFGRPAQAPASLVPTANNTSP
jgi:hypothetical protein